MDQQRVLDIALRLELAQHLLDRGRTSDRLTFGLPRLHRRPIHAEGMRDLIAATPEPKPPRP